MKTGIIAALAAVCLAASSAIALAQDYLPLGDDDSFTADSENGVLAISYKLARGEAFPPDLEVRQILKSGFPKEPVELRFQRRHGGFGTLAFSGERRHMNKSHPFIKRFTYFHTVELPPGVYYVTGTEFTESYTSGGYGEEWEYPDEVTFAFRIKPGAVNYIGDFRPGVRAIADCSVAFGAFDANEGVAPTPEEEPCYADIARKYPARHRPSRFSPEDQYSITRESRGMIDNADFANIDEAERVAVMRTFLTEFRPNFTVDIPVIVGQNTQIDMREDLPSQVAAFFSDDAGDVGETAASSTADAEAPAPATDEAN